jgi:hypothetical protein
MELSGNLSERVVPFGEGSFTGMNGDGQLAYGDANAATWPSDSYGWRGGSWNIDRMQVSDRSWAVIYPYPYRDFSIGFRAVRR